MFKWFRGKYLIWFWKFSLKIWFCVYSFEKTGDRFKKGVLTIVKNCKGLCISKVDPYLRWGAACPLGGWGLAACVLLGTAKLPRAVTRNVPGSVGSSLLELLHSALRDAVEQRPFHLLLTSSCLHVAAVALGAAVLVVCAAYSLRGHREHT